MTEATETAAPETTPSAATVDQPDSAPASQETVLTADAGQPQEQPDGEQGAQEAEQPQGAPEAYDLEFDDGFEIDTDVLEQFQGLAKELGISNEAAQKLIDLQASLNAKSAEASQQRLEGLRAEWANQTRNDPEFGGEHYDANVAVAAKTMQAFGDDSLRQLLNDSGLGNHPALVKFCHRIGKAISEDRLVLPGSQSAPKEMSIVDAFS